MKEIIHDFADLVFPPRCAGCGEIRADGDIPFCENCCSGVCLIRSPLCACCGIPFAPGQQDHLCGDCLLEKPPFDKARAVGVYESALHEAVRRFKYAGNLAAGHVLGRWMALYDFPDFSPGGCSVIVPVPLHLNRLRERGFNQSLVLAQQISKVHSVPLDFRCLGRLRDTVSQTGLGRNERMTNIRGSFRVRSAGAVEGRKVLLVDDVLTTGSTAGECARVLLGAGAVSVDLVTLARTA
ncbi:MAG: ComF family protein [Syntrophales bacterium]|nr:ComF family protein [Syntrophales bacterium]